jgi:hypothetical protein
MYFSLCRHPCIRTSYGSRVSHDHIPNSYPNLPQSGSEIPSDQSIFQQRGMQIC